MAKVNIKKLGSRVGKIFDKTIGKKLAKASLDDQVKFLKRLMVLPGNTMPNIRKNLLEGLPEDIRDKAEKEGMTGQQIKGYYWGCEAFRDLWQKTLQMEEATLDELIRDSLEGE